MNRLATVALLLAAAATCRAADLQSVGEAWTYLASGRNAEQWVVISSTKNNGFVQCARMEGYVRCEFPVWLKASPEVQAVMPRNTREKPFPEVPGTTMSWYMSAQEVAILKKTVADHGLRPEDTYSEAVDEKGRLTGSAHDVRAVLDLDYARFAALVEAILANVWQTTRQDGYRFETDR